MADSTTTSSSLPRSLASRRSSPLHAGAPHTRLCQFGSRSLHRLRARERKNDPEDIYGPYPWEQPLDHTTDFDIQWVQEDNVTLFTSDRLIQIGGSLVPRQVRAFERQRKVKGLQKFRRFQESSYMEGCIKFLRQVDTALKNIGINERVPYNAPLIQFSSWMGGDHDVLSSLPWSGTDGRSFSGNGHVRAFPFMRPHDDLENQIHRVEQDVYTGVLRAFKVQSDDKEGLITELRKILRVSDEEHRELLNKVNEDGAIRRMRCIQGHVKLVKGMKSALEDDLKDKHPGQMMPYLCSPHDSNFNDQQCKSREVTFDNATTV